MLMGLLQDVWEQTNLHAQQAEISVPHKMIIIPPVEAA